MAKLIIPNELKIIINTSIPGYKTIEYRPDMTIRSIGYNNSLNFDPLVKLEPSVVERVQKNNKIKQFFDKDLFKSLIISSVKIKGLDLTGATQNGYIDNNIQVTLDTIFPTNSVIYIGNASYAIMDVLWTKGDWKIDTKKQPSRYNNTVTNNEIINGQKQLQALPPDVRKGPNYVVKPLASNVASGVASNLASNVASGVNKPTANISNVLTGPPKIYNQSDVDLIAKNPVPQTTLNTNISSTNTLKTYFQSYYELLNNLLSSMDYEQKKRILQITKIGDSFDEKLYRTLVSNLSVESNKGGGDCLFIAVADAINYNNYTMSPENRIVSSDGHGLGNDIYTQQYLRKLVYNYLISSEGDLNGKLTNTSPVAAEELNTDFNNALASSNPPQNIEDYIILLNNIYKSKENFLIIKPDNREITDIKKNSPFRVVDKQNLEKYILSGDYWGNNVAIEALCNELGLNIIVIKNENGKFSVFGNFLNNDNCDKKWNKYLFLYNYSDHYELITFNYKSNYIINKKYAIFKRNEVPAPPLYIFFLIFGSFYITLNTMNNFIFYPNIFDQIYREFLKNSGNRDFLTKFNNLFPSVPVQTLLANIPSKGGMVGGINYGVYGRNYNSPYYSPSRNYYSPYYSPGRNYVYNQNKDPVYICYYITIDIELHKGASLSQEELKDVNCIQKWNAIKKAYSIFTGKKYEIPPVNSYSKNKTMKNRGLSSSSNTTYSNRPGYNRPGYIRPGYNRPGYNRPGYIRPGYSTPVYNSSSVTPGYRYDNRTGRYVRYGGKNRTKRNEKMKNE